MMLICSMLVFSFNFKHLLMMLLSMELMMLSLFLLLFNFFILNNYEIYFCMIYLCMSVCEGVLGLSILVSMIRSSGNDYMQSMNLLW
uniref:NADH-ubiquinone oxidoreductase chain 4L n=1 Tax=Discolomatidae sp. 4 ACP-2013 TaxID=1434487 RepID=A0A3G3FWM9_9CUCU|nr:NADH dehydrogenase subunit 4L [Discolomatidae sp. 4 ACP-2013]